MDINDLTIVLSHYGQSVVHGGGPTAVPEPGTLICIGGGPCRPAGLCLAAAEVTVECRSGNACLTRACGL